MTAPRSRPRRLPFQAAPDSAPSPLRWMLLVALFAAVVLAVAWGALRAPRTEAVEGARGFLGFQGQYEQVPGEEGVLTVTDIFPRGPAEAAGLLAEDRVVALDGEPLLFGDPLGMIRAFETLRPGQILELTVERGEQRRRLELRLGTMPVEVAEDLRSWEQESVSCRNTRATQQAFRGLLHGRPDGSLEVLFRHSEAGGEMVAEAIGSPLPEGLDLLQDRDVARYLEPLLPGDVARLRYRLDPPRIEVEVVEAPAYLEDLHRARSVAPADVEGEVGGESHAGHGHGHGHATGTALDEEGVGFGTPMEFGAGAPVAGPGR